MSQASKPCSVELMATIHSEWLQFGNIRVCSANKPPYSMCKISIASFINGGKEDGISNQGELYLSFLAEC
jgi:hypothetical protein